MYNEQCTLIKQTKTTDEYGDTVTTETERTVFCLVKSISQTEFYQAQANGYRPELKVILSDYLDYQDEEMLSYQAFNQDSPEVYTVIRTYRDGNAIELTCRKGVVEDGNT